MNSSFSLFNFTDLRRADFVSLSVSVFGLCVCVVYGIILTLLQNFLSLLQCVECRVVCVYCICICVWCVGIVWCVCWGYVDGHGEGSLSLWVCEGLVAMTSYPPASMDSLSKETECRMPNPCLPPPDVFHARMDTS